MLASSKSLVQGSRQCTAMRAALPGPAVPRVARSPVASRHRHINAAVQFQPSRSDLMTTPLTTMLELAEGLDALVPPLSGSNFKGLHGRVGTVGGNWMYTGAPYFAAMAALTTGVDMSFVFCSPSAATAIKSYSPELIVVPALVDEEMTKESKMFDGEKLILALERAHLTALVFGPGLGLDCEAERQQFKMALAWARSKNMPIVLDGPAIRLLAKEPELIKGYSKAILTPNLPELGDLAAGLGIVLDGAIGPDWQQAVPAVAAALGGPTILSKGPKDVISNGEVTVVCDCAASPRRAGGQGDVMAGTVAAYTSWAENHASQNPEMVMDIPYMILAAYGGSVVTRKASVHAFAHHKHGMLAGNLIPYLPKAVYETEQP